MAFHITGEPASDAVLDQHPFAIVAGMMLDQQYPMDSGYRLGVNASLPVYATNGN